MLPKKGTRLITVGEERYRWTFQPAEYQRAQHLIVVQRESGGPRLVAHIAGANFVTPRLIHRLIESCSHFGWNPAEGGGQVDATINAVVAQRGATQLNAILDSLRSDEHLRALVAALDSWRRSHVTVLADAIDRISDVLRYPERRYDETSWRDLLASSSTELMPEAIDFMFSHDPEVTAERAQLLSRARPDDPRVAKNLLDRLRTQVDPHGASETRLLEVGLEIIASSGDHRLLDVLRSDGRSALWRGSWVGVRVAQAVKALERSFPLGEPYLVDAEPMLEAIQVQLGLSTPSPPADADDLLAAVYGDPSDDDLRRVYADLLLDAEDPRGEMIHLQLEKDLAEDAKARLDHLLELHSDRWLGTLHGWIERVQFERGFPARGTLTWRALAEDCDNDDDSWATLEELGLPFRNVDTDPFLARLHGLIASSVMRSLKSVRDASVEVVEALAAIEGLRIERVHLGWLNQIDGYEEACDRLLDAFARGFPRLKKLELTGRWPPEQLARLQEALAGRAEVKGS